MLAILVAVCFAAAWVLRLGWIADYFSRPVLIGYIHGVAVVLSSASSGSCSASRSTPSDPLPQLWEVVERARQRQRRDGRGRRRVARRVARAAAGDAEAAGGAAGRGRRDRALVGVRPRRRTGSRSWGRSRPGCRASRSRAPRSPTSSGSLPAAVGIFLVSLRRRDPHGPIVRRASTTRTCGDPRSCWRWARRTRGRVHAGLLGRSERLAHRGQRRHGRAQPDRRASSRPRPWRVILLFLTEPVQYLPKAVLGAVIVFAAIGLIEPQAWRALAAVDPVEVAIAARDDRLRHRLRRAARRSSSPSASR